MTDGLCHCGCGERTSIAIKTDPRRGHIKGQPIRFIHGHNRRKSPVEYVEQDCGHDTPCWVWARSSSRGYGMLFADGRMQGAHRVYYERAKGPVPEGLQLDHLCRVRACVNPAHLEVVTNAENSRRGLNTKLTASQVNEIRRLLDAEERQEVIARRFGVRQSHISRINLGESWADA